MHFRKKEKIFISYRRRYASSLAHTFKLELENRGFEVFVDVRNIHAGDFSQELTQKIITADYVVLLAVDNSLKDINKEEDWLVREIEIALNHDKLIIPVVDPNFDWNVQVLPESIQALKKFQHVVYTHDIHDSSFDKMMRMLCVNERRSMSLFKKAIWGGVAIMALFALIFIFLQLPDSTPPLGPMQTTHVDGHALWYPQTHPDCKAVYNLEKEVQDGQVTLLTEFGRTHISSCEGEVLVYLTQTAAAEDDFTTFQPEDIAWDMQLPVLLNVKYFLKDAEWHSAYWDIPPAPGTHWQHASINFRTMLPSFQDKDFNLSRCIAMGWHFASAIYEGPAKIGIRKVETHLYPTNRLPVVLRVQMKDFLASSGVNLSSLLDDGEVNEKYKEAPDGRFAAQVEKLESDFSMLAAAQILLVRISLLGNIHHNLVFNTDGSISGLNQQCFHDIEVIFRSLKKYPDIKVLVGLLDLWFFQQHPDIMSHERQRQVFLNTVLDPLFDHLKTFDQIYGIEIINSPAYMNTICGEQVLSDYLQEIVRRIREKSAGWKIIAAHGARDEIAHFQFQGCDAYAFIYDPENERGNPLKIRRDEMRFPDKDKTVLIYSLLPYSLRRQPHRDDMTFSDYVLQSAYDYGYGGVVFFNLDEEYNRIPFKGAETEAYSEFIEGLMGVR